jgi:competence protein ComEA
VGPKKAAAIVDFREKNGPFKSIYDLDEVYGIGPKTIDKNQDRIIVSVPEESSEQESEK